MTSYVFTEKPFGIPFSGLVAFEEKDCRFRKGLLEMGVADLRDVGSVWFTVGLLGPFDQSAVGDEILDRGEALDRFDLVPDPRHCLRGSR